MSSLEISNEAGLVKDTLNSSIDLDSSVKTLRSVQIQCPTAGYVVVLATGDVKTYHETNYNELVYLAISQTAGELPSFFYRKRYNSTQPVGNYYDPVTLHRTFVVDAGSADFYFLGTEYYEHSDINDIQLTAIFIPSWYGRVGIPGAAGAEGGDEMAVPEHAQSEIERIIDERVRQETKAIESRFEQRLAALREEVFQSKEK